MKKPSKTVISLTSAIIIGAALGSGATYAIIQANDTVVPQAVSAEELRKAEFVPNRSEDIIKRDDKLPEGTISPNTVALKAPDYEGKQLKLRGLVVESKKGEYSMVGQKSDEKLGLRLDFSKSKVDPAQYANSASKVANPVTVTGKLQTAVNPDKTFVYILIVESVSE